VQGEFALVKECLERALEKSGQPVNYGTMAHDHAITMMLTECAVETRDEAALNKWAVRLMELAERDDHKLYAAIASRALGVSHRMAGRFGEAEASLQRALEVFTQMGTRWQRGRTLVEMAELELSRPRKGRKKARKHFSEALRMFEGIQAAADVARTRLALATVG
jgi:tetratricopeptide (TPR) repeat protein